MGLFSRERKHKKTSTVVLFDIGSGSVGAALVRLDQNEEAKPLILYSERIPISYHHIPDFEQLTKSMLSTLLDVTLKLQSEGLMLLETMKDAHKSERVVDDVLFSFASPWSITQTKVFSIENKKAFEVTHKIVDELVEKEIHSFDTTQKSVLGGGDKLILIDKQIVHSMLNGYATSNPYNKMARKAEFHLVLSVIPQHIYDKTGEVVDQLLNGHMGNYNTFAMTSFTAVRDIAPEAENFILVDVSAEVTDIANIRSSSLRDLGSFPQGRHFVFRELARKLGRMPEEIPSTLRNFFSEKSSTTEMLKISTALAEIGEVWLSSFEGILKEVTKNTQLSKKLFFTSDDNLAPWFTTILSRKQFGELIFSDGGFEIVKIDSHYLETYIDKNKGMVSIDPFLGLEAIFLKKVLYQSL